MASTKEYMLATKNWTRDLLYLGVRKYQADENRMFLQEAGKSEQQ